MSELRIRCINKDNGNHDNPHEAISKYGWINEANGNNDVSTRQTMISWLRKESNKAFVKDNSGNIAYCGIRKSIRGTEFLQTYSDGYYNDNLLSLPECK